MEGMVWNVTWWCILTSSKNHSIWVSIDAKSSGGQKNLMKLGFPGILRKMYGRNGLKYGMLMYPDHTDFGHYFGTLVAKNFV